MAYAIVRLDNMSGTHDGAAIKSAKYYVTTTATAIENGNIVALSGLVANEREIFKAISPAATNTVDQVFLVATPELMYDERKHNLNEFRNEAGDIIRVYGLRTGDIFSITAEALGADGDNKVGDYATIGDSTKVKLITTLNATTPEKYIGKCIAKDVVGADTYYVIQVM